MKVIIAGSRSIVRYKSVEQAVVDSGFDIDTVVSGTANGADKLGELWAKKHDKKVVRFVPDWKRFGRKAGILRNIQMAEEAQAVIVIWDGVSTGSKHMISCAERYGLDVYVHRV